MPPTLVQLHQELPPNPLGCFSPSWAPSCPLQLQLRNPTWGGRVRPGGLSARHSHHKAPVTLRDSHRPLTTSQTNALSRPADHCVHLWPGEGALQAELHNPSPLHLQEGTVPPNTHPPSTTVKPSTCNWIVWGRRLLSARLSGPLPPGLGLGGSVDRYGMEQQRQAGLQALFMQLGPLPWVGGGRGSSGGSWGSDPTSSHLCAWPI